VYRTPLIVLGVVTAGIAAWAHWPHSPLPDGVVADRVVVRKSARELDLYDGGKVLRTYSISLGVDPIGPKSRKGDGRTPEGRYVIDYRKEDSAFHRALHISYPRRDQIAAARLRGEPPGGLVMIHGLPNGQGWFGRLHRASDWTNGCIAVTNDEIEELWRVVPNGTPIEVQP